MTGRTSTLYLTEEQVLSTMQDSHLCSNCGRRVTPETERDFSRGPAVYSCPTCGQREEVSWRTVPARVVADVRVIEEPNIILAEH